MVRRLGRGLGKARANADRGLNASQEWGAMNDHLELFRLLRSPYCTSFVFDLCLFEYAGDLISDLSRLEPATICEWGVVWGWR